MPRIRKKTSNRKGTADRAKLKHKIKEGRKKAKKLAKQNPQWKSRVKKDPGIPNAFPYKDQIIAEVERTRQSDALDKERKKEAQKHLKASDVATMSGISLLGPSYLKTTNASKIATDDEVEDETAMDEDGAPLLLDRSLPDLAAVIDKANVVIFVLDARDPQAHRIPGLERSVLEKEKRLLLLLNKIDLVPQESVKSWLNCFRKLYPTLAFRSATLFLPPQPGTEPSKGKAKAAEYDGLGVEALTTCLGSWAEHHGAPLSVAFVGLPNSGKSSIVNSLIKCSSLPVYKPTSNAIVLSSTTPHPQGIADRFQASGHPITLIDTPGISFVSPPTAPVDFEEKARFAAKDMVLRNRGKMEKVTDPLPGASYILSRANAEDLMLQYNIPAFIGGDVTAFLTCVARSTGRLKKAGIPDLTDQASAILRDLRTGKLQYYAIPPSSPTPSQTIPTSDAILDKIYASMDQAILDKLHTRKEMMLAEGVVRIKPGGLETRAVDMEARHLDDSEKSTSNRERKAMDDTMQTDEDDEGSTQEDDDVDNMEDDNSNDDEDQNATSDSDGDETTPPPMLHKRTGITKRAQVVLKQKKVTFASRPLPRTKSSDPLAPKQPGKSSVKTKLAVNSSSRIVANVGSKRAIAQSGSSASDELPYDFSTHFR